MGATSSIAGKAPVAVVGTAETPQPAINSQQTDDYNPRLHAHPSAHLPDLLEQPKTDNLLSDSDVDVRPTNHGGQQRRDFIELNWRFQQRLHASPLDLTEHPETDEELSEDDSSCFEMNSSSLRITGQLTPPGPPPVGGSSRVTLYYRGAPVLSAENSQEQEQGWARPLPGPISENPARPG